MQAQTTLPADAGSASAARQWACRLCQSAGLEVDLDVVALVVSELVTNAVSHARSEVTVTLSADRLADGGTTLRVEVSDADSRLPRLEPVDGTALGGRGLQLVTSMAGRFGVEAGEFGKTVWVELSAAQQPALGEPLRLEDPAPRPRQPA